MHHLKRSLKLFNDYIGGGRTRAFRRPLKVYDYNLDQLDNDFNNTTIDNIEIRDYIETIIESLCIPKQRAIKFFDSHLTVYKFLQELSKDGHIQANYFLHIIDKKTTISNLTLFTGGLISTAVLASIASNPLLSGVVDSIIGFVKSPIGVPILSGLFALGNVVYNIYSILADGKKTEFNLVRDLCFAVLKAIVSLTSCALVIASSISITPVVASAFMAGLVIVSSVLNIAKELFCVVQELIHNKNPSYDTFSPMYNQRAELRHEISYKQHRNAALINLAAAVAAVGVTLISSLVPGGFLIVAGAVAAFTLIYGLQYLMLKMNEKAMREELQQGIKKINDGHLESNEFEMKEIFSLNTDLLEPTVELDSNQLSIVQPKHDVADEAPKATTKTSTLFSAGGSSFFSQNKPRNVDNSNQTDQSSSLDEDEQSNSRLLIQAS